MTYLDFTSHYLTPYVAWALVVLSALLSLYMGWVRRATPFWASMSIVVPVAPVAMFLMVRGFDSATALEYDFLLPVLILVLLSVLSLAAFREVGIAECGAIALMVALAAVLVVRSPVDDKPMPALHCPAQEGALHCPETNGMPALELPASRLSAMTEHLTQALHAKGFDPAACYATDKTPSMVVCRDAQGYMAAGTLLALQGLMPAPANLQSCLDTDDLYGLTVIRQGNTFDRVRVPAFRSKSEECVPDVHWRMALSSPASLTMYLQHLYKQD